MKGTIYYSKNHEWVRIDGDQAWIGISDHAQNALGDIVFVELPDVGSEFEAGDVLGVVESVKSASDIYCPVNGVVADVNEALIDEPEQINENAEEAWLAKIESAQLPEDHELMDENDYKRFCEDE
mgnify:CR=1 FL=1